MNETLTKCDMKNKDEFEELIQKAASDYAYDYEDLDFCVYVRITCEDGWTEAKICSARTAGAD